jgi:hypothetical protein
MLQGLPQTQTPIVNGHIVTYPKNNAQVLIETRHGPLLATQLYGLGRSVAFTSDLSGRWGKDWVSWEHYTKFVAQMVKWVSKHRTDQLYAIDIKRSGHEGTFTIDVTDTDSHFVNQLDLNLKVILPSRNDRTINLSQIAPGRYQGTFPTGEIGEYYLNVFSRDEDGITHFKTFGYGIPYSDEYERKSVDHQFLKKMAETTGGRVLSIDDPPEDLFESHTDQYEYGMDLWPFLLITALGLLLVEVIYRKLHTLKRI